MDWFLYNKELRHQKVKLVITWQLRERQQILHLFLFFCFLLQSSEDSKNKLEKTSPYETFCHIKFITRSKFMY